MSETAAVVAMVGSTYANDMLDSNQRGEDPDALGRLVTSVDIPVLALPTDLGALPQVIETVTADLVDLGVHA